MANESKSKPRCRHHATTISPRPHSPTLAFTATSHLLLLLITPMVHTLVPKAETDSFYAGLPSEPALIYRRIWRGSGEWTYPVFGHVINEVWNEVWNDDLGGRVVNVLDTHDAR